MGEAHGRERELYDLPYFEPMHLAFSLRRSILSHFTAARLAPPRQPRLLSLRLDNEPVVPSLSSSHKPALPQLATSAEWLAADAASNCRRRALRSASRSTGIRPRRRNCKRGGPSYGGAAPERYGVSHRGTSSSLHRTAEVWRFRKRHPMRGVYVKT